MASLSKTWNILGIGHLNLPAGPSRRFLLRRFWECQIWLLFVLNPNDCGTLNGGSDVFLCWLCSTTFLPQVSCGRALAALQSWNLGGEVVELGGGNLSLHFSY